ncbi:MAG: hypothetical protein KDC07_07680, partial [Chitinophagaceae bacterium]|nr:hypothetical protein [Chitinophagaceae bacterium]
LRKRIPFAFSLIPIAYVLYCTVVSSISHFKDTGRDIRPCLAYINAQPQDMQLLVTTPATLYEYYYRMGKATNGNVENTPWSLNPEQFYEFAAKQSTEYMLLCSTDGYADGYKSVIEEVKNKGLVTGECTYGTYTVLRLKPLP